MWLIALYVINEKNAGFRESQEFIHLLSMSRTFEYQQLTSTKVPIFQECRNTKLPEKTPGRNCPMRKRHYIYFLIYLYIFFCAFIYLEGLGLLVRFSVIWSNCYFVMLYIHVIKPVNMSSWVWGEEESIFNLILSLVNWTLVPLGLSNKETASYLQ